MMLRRGDVDDWHVPAEPRHSSPLPCLPHSIGRTAFPPLDLYCCPLRRTAAASEICVAVGNTLSPKLRRVHWVPHGGIGDHWGPGRGVLDIRDVLTPAIPPRYRRQQRRHAPSPPRPRLRTGRRSRPPNYSVRFVPEGSELYFGLPSLRRFFAPRAP